MVQTWKWKWMVSFKWQSNACLIHMDVSLVKIWLKSGFTFSLRAKRKFEHKHLLHKHHIFSWSIITQKVYIWKGCLKKSHTTYFQTPISSWIKKKLRRDCFTGLHMEHWFTRTPWHSAKPLLIQCLYWMLDLELKTINSKPYWRICPVHEGDCPRIKLMGIWQTADKLFHEKWWEAYYIP